MWFSRPLRRACILAGLLLSLAFAAGCSLDGHRPDSASLSPADRVPPLRIPRLSNITIDGDGSDWASRGYLARVLSDTAGVVNPSYTGSATLRLAWKSRDAQGASGLLVLLDISDNDLRESPSDSPHEGDCVEFYVYASREGLLHYHATVAATGETRTTPRELRLYPTTRRAKPAIFAKTTRTDAGYTLEALLPFDSLNIKAAEGTTVALQIIVSDIDANQQLHQLRLLPADWSDYARHLRAVRLSGDASPTATLTASADIENLDDVRVRIDATSDHAGKSVQIRGGGKTLARTHLSLPPVDDPTHAAAIVRLKAPEAKDLEVCVAGSGSPPIPLSLPRDPAPTDRSRYPYLIQLPAGYAHHRKQKYPAILFLHGSGERGSDINVVRRSPLVARLAIRPDLPFIVIAPQCWEGREWSSDKVIDVLDDAIKKYRINTDHVALTGYSMGGYSVWNVAIDFPDRFSAIAPICGGWDPQEAWRVAHIPAWIFHGARDTVVPLKESWKMADALRKLDADVQFTVYPEEDHEGAWNAAYDDDKLFQWFLQSRRPLTRPYATTTPATTRATTTTTSSSTATRP